MTGTFWTTEDLADLLTAWKNRRADITTLESTRVHYPYAAQPVRRKLVL